MVQFRIIALIALCVMVLLWLLMGIFYWIDDRFDKIWGYKAGNICLVLIVVIGATVLIATIAGCIVYLSTDI